MGQRLTVENAPEPAGMISQETLGKVIREFRREAALSQQELADRAGITRQVISNIETGSVLPSLKTLDQIATTLSIPLHAIVQNLDGGGDPVRAELETKIVATTQSLNTPSLELAAQFLQLLARSRWTP